MFQVLLVDDEPIILSGIKFMVNWQALDCHIIGSVRNGGDALESIERLEPDIVVCDINMPVMSGIDVLKACADKPNAPVFIMLTNHEEFAMARESLRFKAVDYLVKSNLEPETLENALRLAITEREARGKLMRVQLMDDCLQENQTQLIVSHLKKVINANDGEQLATSINVLNQQTENKPCFIAQLMMDFSPLPAMSDFTQSDKIRLFEWEREVVEKLAGNMFKNYVLFSADLSYQSLILFCYDIANINFKESLSRFFSKLESTSGNITQTGLSLLATNVFTTANGILEAKKQLLSVRDYYYNTKTTQIFYEDLPQIQYNSLDMQDTSNRLVAELRAKNAQGCASIFDKVYTLLSETAHSRQAGIVCCTEIYSVVSMVLSPQLSDTLTSAYLVNSANMVDAINKFQTCSEALLWLTEMKRQTLSLLEGLTYGKSEIMEKAKQYVISNIDKRIMLNDVADFISISPSYLSALFKKEFNQNFVDYINETKINAACEMIREGKYRIYEISYKLSFENAYYFTKVFKRYTGVTPTDYQRRVRKEVEKND